MRAFLSPRMVLDCHAMEGRRKIVFYDGDCLLCAAVVRWCHRWDRGGKLWFASLGSDFARERREDLDLPGPGEEAETFALFDEETGQVAFRSRAALALASHLGGPWALLGKVAAFVPPALRDKLYDQVARNRRRWWGAREDCSLPPGSLRERILP
ncbi:DCC1-like thiol-disulfide oxidoreductase family protein [Roseibacillus ishigakijimensis]|uniref:DUF393 domain-containing protein n=1 Tax=Roseibacillus ishigakijimensis TaxID=454146 RepID=A0A934RM34_9BACT|nr:DCC1-like thiol-disulfide oxidoreductase family protein [Roseibacillus ishigakijimensis]MBK1833894.1 DUF393 domain-containing protein [Roseibacillus ishigakijimensis]